MLHRIQISEPWDFEHPNGLNVFTAEGIGVVSGPEGVRNYGSAFYLLRVIDSFEVNGEPVAQLLCSPRYEGDRIESVVSSKCTVGIARVKAGFEMLDTDTVVPDHTDYFAIGSISPHESAPTNGG